MGRVIAQVTVSNARSSDRQIRFDAFVDTGSSGLILPSDWLDRLGDLTPIRESELALADQRIVAGRVYGPVIIHIEGFKPIFGEVTMLEMAPVNGQYEPLLGYIPLEQAQAAVDMVGHRLVPVKYADLKARGSSRALK